MQHAIAMSKSRQDAIEQIERERQELRQELRQQCAARKLERMNEPKRRRRELSGPWHQDKLQALKVENARLRNALDAIAASDLVSDEAKLLIIRELGKS